LRTQLFGKNYAIEISDIDLSNNSMIYNVLGRQGLYSNTNNTIETISILYEIVPGIPKYSTSKTTFEYNIKGFPTREIAENYTVE
jgi:hypothetical protein